MHRNLFIPFEAEDASAESPEDSYSDGDEQVLTEGEDDAFESLPQNSNVFAGLEDDDDDPFNRFLTRLQHQSESPEKDTRDVPLTRIPPSPLDTPLWKLRCHPRQQHHVMHKLLRADNVPSGIEIHSIIARSFAPSWLYFEAAHARSEVCSRYLMSVPGVVVIHGSPVVEMVPYDEWLHVLSYDQHDTSAPTGSGPWICIETPRKYCGDLGFVFEGEHGLQVLLIPRIQDDYKAKRTYVTRCQTPLTRPSLRLFYTAEHSLLGSPVILDGDANRVLYGDDLFEYGLLVMNYDKVVAAPASQISCAVEYLFRISRHPLLEWTSIPHPFEWQFCQGDRVTVRLRGGGRRTGIVEQIDGGRRLVVDLDGDEGQQSVVWRQVTKLFDVGNEVECLSGRNEGKTGLIMEIVGTLISFSEDAKTIQVAHANMLRLIQLQPPTFTGSLTTVNSDRVWPLTTQATSSKPWAKVYHSGDRVTIYCGEFKGSFATVEGEHMDNVLLRLGTYGPATSFQVLWVPKEWVIDATNYVGPFHAERSPSPLPRSDTPPPPAEPSEEYNAPAWDPRAGNTIQNEQVINSPGHWALDSAFSHTVFRVAIDPHETNEVPVVQKTNAAEVVFVRKFRKEERVVSVSDIIWKHPKPRETGRMIIINGPYKGRYVRPLKCRHNAVDDNSSWDVIVVEVRGRSERDALVGPELTLKASELVLCWQSEEEKIANKDLAVSIKSGPQRPSRKKIRTE